jgi:hypothetical protein
VVTCGDLIQKIRTHDLLVKVVREIDLDPSGSSDEALYFQIINTFNSNCHIVYVRGLVLATDIFLK